MAGAHRPNRYFEDIVVGESTRSSPLTVSREDMLDFARRWDPQWFHIDEAAARDSLFGEVVASGIYTAALWRIMDHEVNGRIAFVCGVAWNDVRWRRAVKAGDVLVATSVCLSKRPSASRPDVGVAVLHHEVRNQADEIVLSFDSTDLIYRQPGR